jgi:hypothetical protein
MNWRKTIRKLAAATAFLAILFSSTAAGEACEVWQHHQCSSCDTCQICHAGHQAMEAADQGHSLAALEPLDFVQVIQAFSFIPDSLTPRLGTRGPPLLPLS